MKQRLFLITVALGVMAWLAFGADISGAWTARVPGRGGELQETTFNFIVSGEKLTGSVVTPAGARPIENGKIAGDVLSFSHAAELGGKQVKFLFKGKVSGDEINFTRKREGSTGGPRGFTAKRKSR